MQVPFVISLLAGELRLGFANFYRFALNYSLVAAPLMALTSIKSTFRWLPAAGTAYQELKKCFTSAPILQMPD